MKLFSRHAPQPGSSLEERSGLVGLFETWKGSSPFEIEEEDFVSFVSDGLKSNGVVWSLTLMRMTFFAQMEFQYQNLKDRTLFGNPTLALLENPWPNGSTQELLARMEQDVSMCGNAYIYKAKEDELQRLRPDWVKIITNGKELVGYGYTEGGVSHGGPEKIIIPEEMAHWSPYPDPLAVFRGMSWITPVVREVMADKQMTRHKQKFFDNAATPNLLIKNTKNLDEESRERLRRVMETRYEGAENAYRTLVLEGGADATVIGANMQQMSFDAIQAAGENRMASAAGVPGIVAGFKEGLQAATYSNYAQAKRHYVDGTLTFNWGSVSKALEHLMPVPPVARLWYDTSRIPAMKEDRKDLSVIMQGNALAIGELVQAGYDPADVEVFVLTGERPVGGLKHTGVVFQKGAEPMPSTATVPAPKDAQVSVAPPATVVGADGAKALPPPAENGVKPKPKALPVGSKK